MYDPRPAPCHRALWFLTLVVNAGCATTGDKEQSLVPTRHETRTGPFAVYSNFPIAADAPPIRALHSLETDVETTLGARVATGSPAVAVYILNDRQAFLHFLKFYYPELPPRRAFFLAKGSERVVYTYLGDRLEEDLRHEATHALLNVAVGTLPLWLDEGLAEYFEGPDGRRGLNPEHLARLPRDSALGWKPDLAKLESLTSVRAMETRDYRESWAWVHYLLHGPTANKALLLAYLAELRTTPTPLPLSQRLATSVPEAPAAMLAHVERLRTTPIAATATPPPTTVRFQDHALEGPRVVAPPPAPRRSLFGRFRAWFGL